MNSFCCLILPFGVKSCIFTANFGYWSQLSDLGRFLSRWDCLIKLVHLCGHFPEA